MNQTTFTPNNVALNLIHIASTNIKSQCLQCKKKHIKKSFQNYAPIHAQTFNWKHIFSIKMVQIQTQAIVLTRVTWRQFMSNSVVIAAVKKVIAVKQLHTSSTHIRSTLESQNLRVFDPPDSTKINNHFSIPHSVILSIKSVLTESIPFTLTQSIPHPKMPLTSHMYQVSLNIEYICSFTEEKKNNPKGKPAKINEIMQKSDHSLITSLGTTHYNNNNNTSENNNFSAA